MQIGEETFWNWWSKEWKDKSNLYICTIIEFKEQLNVLDIEGFKEQQNVHNLFLLLTKKIITDNKKTLL